MAYKIKQFWRSLPRHDEHIHIQWFTEFQGVWRVNRETEQLEAIAPKHIRCYHLDFSYDDSCQP